MMLLKKIFEAITKKYILILFGKRATKKKKKYIFCFSIEHFLCAHFQTNTTREYEVA